MTRRSKLLNHSKPMKGNGVLVLSAGLLLISLLAVMTYRKNQAMSMELNTQRLYIATRANTFSSFPDEHSNLEEEVNRARASIALLEDELAEVSPATHKEFESINSQAYEAARDEFMAANPRYAASLLRDQDTIENPDLRVREAQAIVMRDYVAILMNIGVSNDRVNVVMDELVAAQLDRLPRLTRIGNSGGSVQYNRAAGKSPRELVGAMLSAEEQTQFESLEREKRERNTRLVLLTSMTPFTPILTFTQRESVIAQLYEFSINPDNANSTMQRRVDSNLLGIESTRSSLKEEFTATEWTEIEAYLDDRIQVIQQKYLN